MQEACVLAPPFHTFPHCCECGFVESEHLARHFQICLLGCSPSTGMGTHRNYFWLDIVGKPCAPSTRTIHAAHFLPLIS